MALFRFFHSVAVNGRPCLFTGRFRECWMCHHESDGTTSYRNLYCNGEQNTAFTKCFAEDFADTSSSYDTMWSTGGLFNAISLPCIVRHDCTDGSTGAERHYTVLSIQTLPSREEAAYTECPTKTGNGGYNSLVIPCGTTPNLSAVTGAQLTAVKGSAWVSRWLLENYSADDRKTSTGQLGTPAIVGIIAGSIVAVLVVLAFAFARKRRSKSSQGQSGLWDDDVITAHRIPREKVRIDQLLSRGAFGEVYAGVYNGEHVAIKMLLPSTRRDIKLVNEFLAEAKLTATMDHPRIVSCVGVAWDSLSDLCVVLEFMGGGDLRTLLSNYEKSGYPVGFNREKTTIALHVAHALTYLHSLEPPVIHRDLKSRNILLNSLLEAKLTDFGISRERLDRTMTAGVGTSLWMAPEVMTGEKYDEKADMFSFGVVLSELDVHTLPYAQAKQEMQHSLGRQMTDATLLQRVAMGAIRVDFSTAGPQSMLELGRACIAVDPSARPTAAEALFKLHEVLSKEMA